MSSTAAKGLALGDAAIAVAGIGSTDYRRDYRVTDHRRNAEDLATEAFATALDDAGIDRATIDGLIAVRVNYERMADVLGLTNLRTAGSLEGSGRMAGVAIAEAAAAIMTGQATTVAIVYGNDGRSKGERYGGDGGPETTAPYDAAQGMTSPGAYVGMMFRRYAHEFGATSDALGMVAMNSRLNAATNPVAVLQEPFDLAGYRASRFIAEPLRLLDYCIINDGGVALILTGKSVAHPARPTAYVRATSVAIDITNSYAKRDFYYAATREASRDLYAAAEMRPDDLDCLQLYDNFTPTVLFALEGFELCGRGEASRWVLEGNLGPDALPANTAGGHTSESYMQGFGHLVESVRQVRGEAGAGQVADCRTVGFFCVSPIISGVIFERR
jgi:acetyl-CoA acetyltransferase